MQQPLILKPTMESITHLQSFITQAAELTGMSSKAAKQLRLAVEEAMVNVINYGQATTIKLTITERPDRLVLTIDDDGKPFDPTQTSTTDLTVPADQRAPGGLGILLMHELSDALTYQRSGGHNILNIEKKK